MTMADHGSTRLHTLLGDYPGTLALKRGEVRSPGVVLDFADVKMPHTAFKRVVRDIEFDVAELALVTFVMAKAYGKPLVLLPAVLFSRCQHPYLVYNAERGRISPAELAGKRVGVRAYSVTTVTWLRGVLADDHGVDLDRIRWVSFEDPHVAEYRDPPTVERAAKGKDAMAMLLAGELDAAILGSVPTDPRLEPVIPDPAAAGADWQRRNQALQLNHLVVVKESLSKSNPQAVREVFRLLAQSKKAAGLPAPGEPDTIPFGVEANRRSLEIALDYVFRQQLIPRRLEVDELFDDVTRALEP
jgi:4,5-dihydroxyphthalate decarboxylase